jgi:hypothetical protein
MFAGRNGAETDENDALFGIVENVLVFLKFGRDEYDVTAQTRVLALSSFPRFSNDFLTPIPAIWTTLCNIGLGKSTNSSVLM